MPPDQRLHGSGNVALWLLTITGILVTMGLRDFLRVPIGPMDENTMRRWDLADPKSAHTRAYGVVIKNIADAALQQDAIRAMDAGEQLPDFLARIGRLQRSRDEIVSDLERLRWQTTDTIETFFKKGQAFFNELQAAAPGVLSESTYISQMSRKLPPSYTPQVAQVLSWETTEIQKAVAAFRRWEAHLRMETSERAATSTADGAGPSNLKEPQESSKIVIAMAALEKVVRDSIGKLRNLSHTKDGRQASRQGRRAPWRWIWLRC